MSDHFLRLVSRSAKFDSRSAHASTKHLDLQAPQKATAKAAPVQHVAAALDFFGNAAPAAAAAAAAAASPAIPAKSSNGKTANGAQKSAKSGDKKRRRDADDDEEESAVKREEGEGEDDDDEIADDGENDLEDDEDGEEEEEDEDEGGVQLFGGARAAVSDEEEEDADTSGASKSARRVAARVRALKEFRRDAGIHVQGSDISAPFKSFDDLVKLGVPEYMVRNISLPVEQDGCGYKEPTPIQQQAVTILIKGRDLLACAPTGSGKTAAFVIPILSSLGKPGKTGFRALVLSPTRELSEQTARCFQNVGRGRPWKILHLNKANAVANTFGAAGGAAAGKDGASSSSSGIPKRDVLIATPLRLVHLIDTGAIDLSGVEWLVLDEADRLFEDGFVDQLDRIMVACSNPSLRRAMFSATMMQGVESLARTVLREPVRLNIGARNSATESIKQSLVFVSSEEGKLVALRQMIQAGLDIPVLLFVQSKERAQQLYGELVYDNLQVDVIHADRTAAQRSESIRRFRAGSAWVLICTDLMARGIDFLGVRTVINYDFPQSTVSYIHRIGRTGRAGREGKAVTFFTEADKPLLHSVAKLVHQSGNEVPAWMLQMHKIGTKKAKKLKEQAPPRAAIVPNPKSAAANKKARDRKKKRKTEGKKGAAAE